MDRCSLIGRMSYLAVLTPGMYTREEVSRIRQAFWTAFGRYMQPVHPAGDQPVSWLNYKTGVNGISFKMDADRDHAVIMILLSHGNEATRHVHYDQFMQFKQLLQDSLGEDDWVWQADKAWNGKTVGMISKTLQGVNVLNQSHWSDIISFLKPRIIALDAFWNMARPAFEQ